MHCAPLFKSFVRRFCVVEPELFLGRNKNVLSESGFGSNFFLSVGDPDFGPPGSGPVSQRYESGSFYQQAKIVRKPSIPVRLKGMVQPFELGGVTRLIRSAVKFCMAGNLKKKILMLQSHERSLKLICVA